ncbi:protein new-glue 3-like [Drosophila sulfurigaster albostrigata]|uniref:protein new-glue 3-like n=1 Tax=Drosophila sulfurigaster albostrigata TaxID=89887 RepID=UPI002D219A16|nr:protein new-glue 3-like [Drosophila sulfurigaster albostrigata]
MKSFTIILTCAVLAVFFVRSGDAVACSTTVTTDCTDCSETANADEPDCTTTTTTTTEASVTLKPSRRMVVSVSNLKYTNVRRIRVNRNGSSSSSSSSSGTSSSTRNSRRTNNRSSRRGRNVRVLRG